MSHLCGVVGTVLRLRPDQNRDSALRQAQHNAQEVIKLRSADAVPQTLRCTGGAHPHQADQQLPWRNLSEAA